MIELGRLLGLVWLLGLCHMIELGRLLGLV